MGRVRQTDKSSKTTKKTLWQKLKGHTSDNNNDANKRKLFYMLSNALKGGAKIGSHVFVGSNTVLKKIINRQVSIVCVSRDSPKSFFNSLIEACALCSIPVVALPAASAVEMASTFSLKRATVFALPLASTSTSISTTVPSDIDVNTEVEKAQHDSDLEVTTETISEVDRIDSMIDGVRDAAFAMYTPNFLFRDKKKYCRMKYIIS
jgi:ribosomal protein L7Ae-like RNA K-turn-binding protein